MKFIKYIVSACLIAPALWLLIAGPRDSADVPPGTTVIVDYWEKWTADEGAAMRQIVDDFNQSVGKEKHINVRCLTQSNVDQKTLVATAAGVPPDVAGLWDINMVQFASLDALTPLDDLCREYGIGPGTYMPVFWNACHYQGHMWALVSTPMAVALHYNTDEFKEAGLTHPPETIDELNDYARRLDIHINPSDPTSRLSRTGFLPTVPGWYVNFSYLWFGGSIWDAQHHKFTLTDPKVVKSFQWIRDYSERLKKDAVNDFQASSGNFDSPQNPFLAGTLAMTQQGPWMANYIINLNPSMNGMTSSKEDDTALPLAERRARMHWAACAFPSDDPNLKDVTLCQFDTLVIPRGARHPHEAFEFMAYVTRQAVMEKLCKMHSKNSPLAQVSDDFLQHHRNAYIDVFENLSKSPNAHATPQIPIYPEVDTEIGVLIQKLARLDAEPQAGLQELQDRLQRDYDLFVEKQQARKGIARGN